MTTVTSKKWRLAVFELQPSQAGRKVFEGSGSSEDNTSSASLQTYFQNCTSSKIEPKIHIFVVEGGHTCFAEQEPPSGCESCHACILQQHVLVPKRIFREHARQSTTFAFNEDTRIPKLPSRLKPDESFVLNYFDLRTFKGDPSSVSFQCPITKQHLCPGSDGALTLTCSQTGREIQCHEWQNRAGGVQQGTLFIIPRKCSFWTRKYKEGGSDSIIICDPQVSEACVGNTLIPLTANAPFQRDDDFEAFLPVEKAVNPSSAAVGVGAPRSGMFDDLEYYLTNFGNILDCKNLSYAASIFPKKIATTSYEPLIAFVSHQISSMRSRGWALKRDTQEQLIEAAMVETEWSRFRCSEYIEAVRGNLDALAIPRSDAKLLTTNDWEACGTDFQWIHQQLKDCRTDYEALTTSMAASAGIIGNRKAVYETSKVSEETSLSRREQRATKTIQMLATGFLPPALVASLFSMTDKYAPGERRFWVYFAVTLPITLSICFVTLIADHGFTEEPDRSLARSLKFLRERVKSYRNSNRTKVSTGASALREDPEKSTLQVRSRANSTATGSQYQLSIRNGLSSPAQPVHLPSPVPLQHLQPLKMLDQDGR